jgi:tRNA splicing endonuclease
MRRESLVDFFRKYHPKSDQEHASFVPHVFPHTARTEFKLPKMVRFAHVVAGWSRTNPADVSREMTRGW